MEKGSKIPAERFRNWLKCVTPSPLPIDAMFKLICKKGGLRQKHEVAVDPV
jgi:hypothetical protein